MNFELTKEECHVLNDSIEHIKTEATEEDSYVPENFEQILIKTEERFLPDKNVVSNKKVVEICGMETGYNEDGREVQNKNMEFIYVKTSHEEEWTEPSTQEADPLAISTTIEIKVEPPLIEKEEKDITATDTITSTSQDMEYHNLQLGHFMSIDYSTSRHKRNRLYTETEDKHLEKIMSNNDNSEIRSVKNSECFLAVENEFICSKSTCNYTTDTLSRLKRHINRHKVKKTYKCTVCDYCTTESSNLKIHTRVHTGEKPYKCTVCDYSSTQSSRIKQHMIVHTGEKNFSCAVCDFLTSDAFKLKLHTRVHTGEKPYKCTMCDYCTTQSSSLKIHTRKHTGEKPYKCTVCDYCTTESSNLKMHTRLHTGEKPFKCTVCDYCTTDSSNLKVHTRVHTGEKPYKCTVCGYSSTQSSRLKRHMIVHTGGGKS